MATYFVAAGGSNTAPYDTWAKAATSLQTALTAASTAGDRIIIQYNGVPSTDAEVAVDTTYTAAADVTIISASNDGGSAFTPTAMGEGNWIGHSSLNRGITIAGGFVISLVGVTIRVAGGSPENLAVGGADNQVLVFKNGRIDIVNTSATLSFRIGLSGTTGVNSSSVFENSIFRFGNAAQGIEIGGSADFVDITLDAAGSAPAVLFKAAGTENGGLVRLHGCNLSTITGDLVGNMTGGSRSFRFYACKLGAGVVPLGTQTVTNQSTVEVELLDCSSGDEHYHHAYYNALGSMVVDTGIYANDGAKYDGTNGCSWKIITSSLVSRANPFVTPWMSKHHAGTSAIIPRIEILRNGSATAYTDDEVWGQWSVKATAGASLASLYSDRVAVGGTGTAQPTGVGLAGWTGEGGTAWSGKLEPLSAITPAEIGDIAARICVGEPSMTVYADPTIRGA